MYKALENPTLRSLKSTLLSIFLIVGHLPCNTAKTTDEPPTSAPIFVSDNDGLAVKLFTTTNTYNDLVKQNANNSYTNLFFDFNGGEESMEGKGSETGLEIDFDDVSLGVTKGTKKMSLRID